MPSGLLSIGPNISLLPLVDSTFHLGLHQTGTIAASQLSISVVFKMMNIKYDDTLELNSALILNI